MINLFYVLIVLITKVNNIENLQARIIAHQVIDPIVESLDAKVEAVQMIHFEDIGMYQIYDCTDAASDGALEFCYGEPWHSVE